MSSHFEKYHLVFNVVLSEIWPFDPSADFGDRKEFRVSLGRGKSFRV